MTSSRRPRILFSGYAPVHYLCFEPIHRGLERQLDAEVFFTGGLRERLGASSEEGFAFDLAGLYDLFGLERSQCLEVADAAEMRFDIEFSAHSRPITPRHCVDLRIQIFHGVSFRNRGVRRRNVEHYDRLFLIGPYMASLFHDSGLLERDDRRGVPIGFPKTDRLLDGSLERATLLAERGLDGSRPIVLYAPTGGRGNSLESMGEEVIGAISGDGGYDLLIKPHDHPKNPIDWFERLRPLTGPRTRLVRELDVVPLLYLADVLITDASSVANEYTLLNRPIVFLDVPQLIETSRAIGAMVDLSARRIGSLVERPEQVLAALEAAVRDPGHHVEERRQTARRLFYNPGSATAAALRYVHETLSDARVEV